MLTLDNLWVSIKQFFQEYVINTAKSIEWKDAIDIILLSAIFFFLYRFIRDRRAGKLLMGLAFVFVLTILAEAVEFRATRFIFSDFRQLGVIAILIIFQPELRSALEKVGGTPLSGLKNITSESRDLATINAEIDAISTAASDLSREKVGALIVIERSTKLGEYIKSGVLVDAVISPHILRNLFFNKAPLHDGAVIIRNSRICAAGCFLPLSTKEDIDKDLGTRHRAAIGMSEASDAVVIIVSEETGTISLSVDGNLKRNYNYRSLKQELNGLLIPQVTEDADGKRKHNGKHQKKNNDR
ncbi:MAG: TIGR00159 family protein [Ruminococcaceae bacterium]|nr:TIGR00159 family protein [Oscillospiraceae bacterium]